MQPDTTNYEAMPPMMFVSPPPPPPPLSFPAGPGPMLTSAPPPPPPPPIQRHAPFVQPPPPPPPPPTVPPSPVIQAPPNYSAPPPILPPMLEIDTSRPPPPLPDQIRNGKRKFDHVEAGPSKLRKSEEPKADSCENCVQREIRINLYKQQMEKLQCEEEYQRLLYKMKSEEFEQGKEILRSVVTPEMYRILEEYIEGGPPQVTDIFAQLQSMLFSGSSTTVPRQFLMQLMEYVFESQKKNTDAASTSALRLDETINQALSIPRRTNIATRSTSDVLQTFFELLRNGNTSSERSQVLESRVETHITSSTSQTSNGFTDGQSCESSSSTGRFASASNAPVRGYSNVAVPPISTTTSAAPYAVFHPGVPPPLNRPYFPQTAGGGSMPMMAACRPPAPAPPAPQVTARPSATPAPAMMPSNPPGYPPYIMGRFPHPPNFYPPYQ